MRKVVKVCLHGQDIASNGWLCSTLGREVVGSHTKDVSNKIITAILENKSITTCRKVGEYHHRRTNTLN